MVSNTDIWLFRKTEMEVLEQQQQIGQEDNAFWFCTFVISINM